MRYLRTLVITLLLLLSACSNDDSYDSFVIEDATKYNNQILSALQHNEPWAQTPFLIVGELFGPAYQTEGGGGYAFEQTEVTDDFVRVAVTQEGLLDDSVYGEKRIIDFRYKADRWVIDNIKLGFKCQRNRGHQNYAGELCN
ncbi:hypothetical protein MKJ04_21935 [Pontibacter sp. E15-1]|uniref:hypothetical protein n=1 Tax=Pontibacter sp. E15-1 TaxID=2919918 RepID=UPI001F4F767B|nr:hypothetical protein [Pontibacter sp. E15-1]MCJ8167518.1 hypothetical protein [Pontibacter sp. E15-1]